MDKFKQANAVMEQVLSHNFAVREAPLFHLVRARLHHHAVPFFSA